VQQCPELPVVVRTVLSRLPAFPPSWIAAQVLTIAAPRVIGAHALADVDGLAFRFTVRDAGISFAFRLRLPRFEPLAPDAPVDVEFAANAIEFVRIAARESDPDTLFFERRLSIEGDTDAGLRLKNLLDSVEIPRWMAGADSLLARLLSLASERSAAGANRP
jgi:predicted lipid carrier protein YhbT